MMHEMDTSFQRYAHSMHYGKSQKSLASLPAFRRGPVCRGQFGEVLSFLRPTVQTIIECPRLPGTITVEWFLPVRTGFALGHRASTFHPCAFHDNNSCAISITSPRSLFRPRTQHGRWGHREEVPASVHTMGLPAKSCLAGLSPLSGTPSERGVNALE